MSQQTTNFFYWLFGINNNPPPTPQPPAPQGPSVIRGSRTASDQFDNPLNDPAIAITLLQERVTKLKHKSPAVAIATQEEFDKQRDFFIFVPKKLETDFVNAPAGSKPKARVSLFFGVRPEMTLFRLREFFKDETNSVLITVPGTESGWAGIPTAFGCGITTSIIENLLSQADLAGIDFTVEVIAPYSTGYRGANLTIINQLVDLTHIKRLVYFDAWYHHDDHPLMTAGSPYDKKNTLFAVDTVMSKSPNADVVIYAFTHSSGIGGGVPRTNPTQTNKNIPDPPLEPIAPLITNYGSKIRFIDFEYKDSRPAIDDELEKICLARLIQLGTGNQFQASAIHTSLMPLINALPTRGSFGTLGRAGFTDLYNWVSSHSAEISSFSITKAMTMVNTHRLLRDPSDPSIDWTNPSHYEMRHRMFVLELGKEPLLP